MQFTFLASLLFFIAALATLPHYGVNWDAVSHLSRGQAYLHFYLTGKTNYKDLPQYKPYFQKVDGIFFKPDIPKEEIPRISIYQTIGRDLDYVIEHYDYGHPHISDVLSSVFNFVLFQKLGILNDIDSYRVYGIFLAAALVGLVFWWTARIYGRFAGIVAALSLSLYPLFWAESHFNTEKDIPETVYWSFMLFSIWKGVTGKSWKWILVSGVFFGLALGTKLNVLFSIFVFGPWIVFFLVSKKIRLQAKIIFAGLAAPFLGLAIVVGTWPAFWSDPQRKITQLLSFYRDIGTNSSIGINTYALDWILYTTPLVILFLTLSGIMAIVSRRFSRDHILLFLLWLVVPILRVSLPGTNIYGGVRQIMEFIPAMAILAGIGAGQIVKFGKPLRFIVLLAFIPITFKLIEIHPNENVYFNPLIGGIGGAKERDFPGWGVSFGAPYRKAIEWINQNAEEGAKLTLGYEILSNIPGIWIRPDIEYKSNRSGYLRQGEYVISLRFQGTGTRSYFDMYLDRMIEPLYKVTVDSVPILKIWKNDEKYLKSEWRNEAVLEEVKVFQKDNVLSFDTGNVVKLSRLEMTYNQKNCPELLWGYLMISKDGKDWERVPGVLPEEVRIKSLGEQPKDGKFIEPFVGQEARYINFFATPYNACVTRVQNAKLYYFK